MIREEVAPRADWQTIIRDEGIVYSQSVTPSGQTSEYWNESAVYSFTLPEVELLERRADQLYQMCLRAVDYMLSGAMGTLGLTDEAFALAARSWQVKEPSLYGRFDIVWDSSADVFKLLELNGDTPTGVPEGWVSQWSRAEALHPDLGEGDLLADQWNGMWEAAVRRFAALRPTTADGQNPTLFLVSTDQDGEGEDECNLEVVASAAISAGWDTVIGRVENLGFDYVADRWVLRSIAEDGTESDQFVDYIFKLYPWEQMLDDQMGPVLLEKYDRMKMWLEPAWKMALSTKLLLVALWRLYPNHPFLLEAATSPLSGDYVEKPIFGREGAGITVRRDGVEIVADGDYDSPFAVYQRYCQIPAFVDSAGALHYPVLGIWLIDGETWGVGVRESDGPITDYYCRFVPNLIDKTRRATPIETQAI